MADSADPSADISANDIPVPSGRPRQLRVLIVDGHPAIGSGLRHLLGIMPGVEVCGLEVRGEDGLRCAGATPPDVVLIDAELPNGSGLTTIRKLRACLPTTRVVALGLYSDRRAAALASGAHGFVLKDAGFDALYAAIVADRVCGERDLASARTPRSVC
ncbi:MAG: response regulator transcription factor [Chloroflexota bacterium]